jgi:hypothetical protein
MCYLTFQDRMTNKLELRDLLSKFLPLFILFRESALCFKNTCGWCCGVGRTELVSFLHRPLFSAWCSRTPVLLFIYWPELLAASFA